MINLVKCVHDNFIIKLRIGDETREIPYGSWQKLHSHAYTRATVCSFVSFTYYLSYFEEMDSNKDTPLTLPFASFISVSQLIIVIWIKTSVGTTTVFHTGISKAVAVA
jgi:hypothetical protein